MKKTKQYQTKQNMKSNKTEFKQLPKDTKFATFNSETKEIILGEYLIATLIYNGETFNKILESANEIEDKKEREDVKKIMYNIILDFVELNPEFNKF